MEKPRNPFILGHRIERPYFCDRFTAQENLTKSVLNERNVVLLSPRRMGKTSLINITLHDSPEIRETYNTIFIDILQSNSLSEFTYLLGKAVFDILAEKSQKGLKSFLAALKSLKGSFGFDPITGGPSFNIQLGDIHHPEYTLDEIFRFLEESEKPSIIVIDEFQQITKYPEKNTEAILRQHTQRMANATFIFAGSEFTILQEMFVSSKRPFYNSSEMMYLGPISVDTYVEFAETMFEERNRHIEEEPIRWIYRLFDGNTFYMQRTMNESFADTPEYLSCGKETVERSLRSMLASNEVTYREILSKISISQKATLIALAQEKTTSSPMSSGFIKKYSLPSPSSVQSAIQKLTKAGLVVKNSTGYSLTDPLLRIFVNQLYGNPEF